MGRRVDAGREERGVCDCRTLSGWPRHCPTSEYYTKTDANRRRRARVSSVTWRACSSCWVTSKMSRQTPKRRPCSRGDEDRARSRKHASNCATRQTNYHKMTIAELQKLTPGFPWPAFFRRAKRAADLRNRRRTAGILHGDEQDVPTIPRRRVENVSPLAPRARLRHPRSPRRS